MNAHVFETEVYGCCWYRWLCSCGKAGNWNRVARAARNGGQRHVAAMERSATERPTTAEKGSR